MYKMFSKKYRPTLIQHFILISCTLASSVAFARYFADHQIYSGMGVGVDSLKFKSGYGENFFPLRATNLELFFGYKASNRFGLEFGVSASPKHSKYVTLRPGDPYPGTKSAIAAGDWETWFSTFQTQSVFAGLTDNYALNNSKTIHIFGFAGLALAKIHATTELQNADPTPDAEEIAQSKRNFKAVKLMPMAKIGFDFKFKDNSGLRVLYAWKGYSRFNHIKSSENPQGNADVRLENAHAVHLDFFVLF
jgi:hypothetical protein